MFPEKNHVQSQCEIQRKTALKFPKYLIISELVNDVQKDVHGQPPMFGLNSTIFTNRDRNANTSWEITSTLAPIFGNAMFKHKKK